MRRVFPVLLCLSSCGWNPSRPFDRESPAVKEAIVDLDAGDAASAASRLEDYLSTGACKDGSIGTPELLKRRADGSFDLGLSLFRIGEQYGRRFGEEDTDKGVDEGTRARRHAQIECALRIVETIADDDGAPGELRARAHYLEGNLAFLDGRYEQAVRAYDFSLVLSPGEVDAGDPIGRDAAYNRAIALRRIEDQKDAGSDASHDASPEGGGDAAAQKDAGGDRSKDGGQDGADAGHDGGSPNGGKDAESPPPPQPPDAGDRSEEASAPPPPPSTEEDQRMLDQLENAPTLQQEEAKRFGKKRVRGMADK
jgi:tetratricopeptide (TPR) repeat protein